MASTIKSQEVAATKQVAPAKARLAARPTAKPGARKQAASKPSADVVVAPAPKPAKKSEPLAAASTGQVKARKNAHTARKTKPVQPARVNKAVKPLKAARPAKAKLVRDSFTMPQADFDLVAILKARTLKFQRATKKSELLRAGLHALQALGDAELGRALDALVPLKPGRPKNAA